MEKNDDKLSLMPVERHKEDYLPEKISSILFDTRETNEFTRMMINVALFTSRFDFSEDVKLLFTSGRGTTLFEGACAGFDVCGIEIDKNSALDCYAFFKKFLSKERLKHKTDKKRGTRKVRSWLTRFTT